MEAAVASNKPEEFVEALLKTVENATSSDVLRRLKELLQKSTTILTAKLNNIERECIDLAAESSEVFHTSYPEVQFLEPRGRFTLKFGTQTIVIDGKGGNGSIPINKITHLCLLPSHASSKKEGEDFLAVIFSEPIKICGKSMTNLLLNLSKSLPKLKPGEIPPEEGSDAAITESRRIGLAFKNATGLKVHLPNPRLFTSVSQQRAFIRCHKGVNEGAIYPLSCGMVFVKPLIFIGTDNIASFTAGRGGGSGNTRFVDIQIETTKDVNYEFSNIDREELAALNAYVKGFLEARRKKLDEAATQPSSASAALLRDLENGGDDDDDSDDDDDEDYDDDDDDGDDNDDQSNGNNSDSDDSDLNNASDSDNEGSSTNQKHAKNAKGVPQKKKSSNAGDDASRLKKTVTKKKPVDASVKEEINLEKVEHTDAATPKQSNLIPSKKRPLNDTAEVNLIEISKPELVNVDAVADAPTPKRVKTESESATVVSSAITSVVPPLTEEPAAAVPVQPKKNTLFAAWGQSAKSSNPNANNTIKVKDAIANSSTGTGLEIIDV